MEGSGSTTLLTIVTPHSLVCGAPATSAEKGAKSADLGMEWELINLLVNSAPSGRGIWQRVPQSFSLSMARLPSLYSHFLFIPCTFYPRFFLTVVQYIHAKLTGWGGGGGAAVKLIN
jgi:hypothetical protein